MTLVVETIADAMKLAQLMAQSTVIAPELQGNPADCLLVIEQAVRWKMSPFALAQEVSIISRRDSKRQADVNKMMFTGKVVAAAINSSGILDGRLAYDFSGDGPDRTVTVTGQIKGKDKPDQAVVRLGDVQTSNEQWRKQTDQQLIYHGSRVWGRRWASEIMLGVYSAEEFSEETTNRRVGQVLPKPSEDRKGRVALIGSEGTSVVPEDKVAAWVDQLVDEVDRLSVDGDIGPMSKAEEAAKKAHSQGRLDLAEKLDSAVNRFNARVEQHAVDRFHKISQSEKRPDPDQRYDMEAHENAGPAPEQKKPADSGGSEPYLRLISQIKLASDANAMEAIKSSQIMRGYYDQCSPEEKRQIDVLSNKKLASFKQAAE